MYGCVARLSGRIRNSIEAYSQENKASRYTDFCLKVMLICQDLNSIVAMVTTIIKEEPNLQS